MVPAHLSFAILREAIMVSHGVRAAGRCVRRDGGEAVAGVVGAELSVVYLAVLVNQWHGRFFSAIRRGHRPGVGGAPTPAVLDGDLDRFMVAALVQKAFGGEPA
jgi:hypothetical protein